MEFLNKKEDELKKHLIFIILTIFIFGACGSNNQPKQQTERLEESNQELEELAQRLERITRSLELAIANLEKEENAIRIGSQISGEVKKIYVKVGNEVKKGQILAEIEDPFIYHRLKQRKMSYERALINLSRTKENLNNAGNRYKESSQLFERGLESKSKKEGQENNYSNWKKNLESAEIAAEQAKDQLELSKIETELTKVRSPCDGIVRSIYFHEGEVVKDTAWGAPIIFTIRPVENGQR